MCAGITALPTSHRHRVIERASRSTHFDPHPPVRRILKPGEHLYHAGESCTEAFLVCSGSVQSYYVHADGEEQILGLHGAGEVVGFDSLLGLPSGASVKAVDTSGVQVILNPARLLDLDGSRPEARMLLLAMREEISRCTQRLHMERHPSERRLAEFLLDFAERAGHRGLSSQRLVLPYSRRVLSRYLGLAPETLSRTFSQFQSRAILEVNNREVNIIDLAALKAIAYPESCV
jgi:CRP/FNR family transcriptional regulator, anaerobic regulatory protein